MPCYDGRDSAESRSAEAVQAARKEFRHNSDVAQMLCDTLKKLEADNALHLVSVPTQIWWEEHKARDAKRGTN